MIAREIAALAADAQTLGQRLNVGDVVAAVVLPSNGLTDLVAIAGLRVAAELPPTLVPGQSIAVLVTGFNDERINLQILPASDLAPEETPAAATPSPAYGARVQAAPAPGSSQVPPGVTRPPQAAPAASTSSLPAKTGSSQPAGSLSGTGSLPSTGSLPHAGFLPATGLPATTGSLPAIGSPTTTGSLPTKGLPTTSGSLPTAVPDSLPTTDSLPTMGLLPEANAHSPKPIADAPMPGGSSEAPSTAVGSLDSVMSAGSVAGALSPNGTSAGSPTNVVQLDDSLPGVTHAAPPAEGSGALPATAEVRLDVPGTAEPSGGEPSPAESQADVLRKVFVARPAAPAVQLEPIEARLAAARATMPPPTVRPAVAAGTQAGATAAPAAPPRSPVSPPAPPGPGSARPAIGPGPPPAALGRPAVAPGTSSVPLLRPAVAPEPPATPLGRPAIPLQAPILAPELPATRRPLEPPLRAVSTSPGNSSRPLISPRPASPPQAAPIASPPAPRRPAELQEPAELLRALRLPVTATNVAAARMALESPAKLPNALATLERALVDRADPRVATLVTLTGFIARLDPRSPVLAAQIAAFVDHAVTGPEAQIAKLVTASDAAGQESDGEAPKSEPTAADGSSGVPTQHPTVPPLQAARAGDLTAVAERGSATRVGLEYDLKTNLLTLAADRTRVAGSPEAAAGAPLDRAIAGALTALTAIQLDAAALLSARPDGFAFTVPIALPDGFAQARVRIDRDAPQGSHVPLDGDNFHIAFVLETRHLGTVAIDLNTVGRAVKLSVQTEAVLAQRVFGNAMSDLTARLTKLRYHVATADAVVAPVATALVAETPVPSIPAGLVDLNA